VCGCSGSRKALQSTRDHQRKTRGDKAAERKRFATNGALCGSNLLTLFPLRQQIARSRQLVVRFGSGVGGGVAGASLKSQREPGVHRILPCASSERERERERDCSACIVEGEMSVLCVRALSIKSFN
jgi:hypothetical protein